MPPTTFVRTVCLAAALTAFAAITFGPAPAAAADREGVFAVEGVGQTACREYVQARQAKSSKYYNYGGWIEGYLSAYNQVSEDTYDITPFEGIDLIAALVNGFCQANPDAPFFQAIASMVRELRVHRLKERSEPITVEADGKSVKLYTIVLERAQRALKEAGFYDGAIDGAYGPNTRQALEAFQADRGIEQSGLPDQVTLLRLLRSPPTQ